MNVEASFEGQFISFEDGTTAKVGKSLQYRMSLDQSQDSSPEALRTALH